VQVPLSTDLRSAVDRIGAAADGEVFVSSLDGNATITVRAPAPDEDAAQRLERELRVRVHEALRAEGVFA
jgi:hypothetical protein